MLIDIRINGSELKRVKCFKYLGLMVDQKLRWVDHIAHVKSYTTLLLYPYFIYCVDVLSKAATAHLLPLCLLQNKVVRIITYSNKRAQMDSLYLELNLLPLYKIAHHRIVLIMYTYHHHMLPIALHDFVYKQHIVHSI